MPIYYTLVLGLLLTETVLFALISLPLPSKIRGPLLKTLSIPFHSQHFQIVLKCILGFILVLFIDSFNRMNKITNELHAHQDNPVTGAIGIHESRSEIQARRFYAQRNAYLCGFTLFLTLIVNKTFSLVFELLAIKEKLREHEKTSKIQDLDTVDEDSVKELKSKISEQDETIENLKSQATALSDEYDGLSQRKS
ncbi:hypothetical protein OGAPHI_006945 [Ogataea philodendri]|uniref:Endoplasmic reticulum transmembrane protein n=1 Tax=Ogataea philodendri TaxID=1378263 RepID=A0A9P8NWJ0_9ASCO|nr:uncharacterized protein OGAPHI_006945 [Ogataea philodendri]KAH3660359.1 hypothetical protein OGAPHI_006945 [Ogataea philodendri]